MIEMVQLKHSQTPVDYRQASPLLQQDMCHQQQPQQDQVQSFSYSPSHDQENIHLLTEMSCSHFISSDP